MLPCPALALSSRGAAQLSARSVRSVSIVCDLYSVPVSIADTHVFDVVMCIARYGSDIAHYHRPRGC